MININFFLQILEKSVSATNIKILLRVFAPMFLSGDSSSKTAAESHLNNEPGAGEERFE